MDKLTQILKSMKWYVILFFVGGAVATLAILTHSLTTEQSLLTAPVTITAFWASLTVANAAFSKSESKHKWFVQYAVIPMFGIYVAILLHERNYVEAFLLTCAAATHMAYWLSSVHSRAFLLAEFRAAFGTLLMTQRLVAMLNGTGYSDVSNGQIVVPLLKGKNPNLKGLEDLVPAVVLEEAAKEIAEINFIKRVV